MAGLLVRLVLDGNRNGEVGSACVELNSAAIAEPHRGGRELRRGAIIPGMRPRRSSFLAMGSWWLALLAAACSGEGGGGGPTAPDTRSLSLSAAPASIGVAEESVLTAVARNASGGELAGA